MKKLRETQMRAQDATRAQAEATADFIDKMELATGIADDDLRPAMENLALTGMSVKKSQDQLALAADIAIAKNVSLTSASSALAKAYNGQLTGLSRLGIKTTDAAGEALSFAEVQKLLRDRFEGAAKAAGKTDPLKRLSAAYHQVQEDLGEGFLPLLRRFAKFVINSVVPWIKGSLVPAVKRFSAWIKDEAVPWIQQKLIPAIQTWWAVFKEKMLPVMQDVWSKLGQLWGKIKELYAAINEAFNRENGDMLTDFFNAFYFGASLAWKGINILLSFWGKMIDAWTWVINNAGRVVDGLAAVGNAAGAIGGAVADVVPGLAAGGHIVGRAGGGWTMVGEHGPELISNRGFVKPHSASMGAGGGGVTLVQNFNAPQDPVAVGRETRKALLSLKRAEGGRALGLA
jgi:hypothetical protein